MLNIFKLQLIERLQWLCQLGVGFSVLHAIFFEIWDKDYIRGHLDVIYYCDSLFFVRHVTSICPRKSVAKLDTCDSQTASNQKQHLVRDLCACFGLTVLNK